MGKIYNSINDFDNISVRIVLNKKSFNSIIKVHNDAVYLSVDVSKDYEYWNSFDQNLNQINGKTIYNDIPINFINCFFSERYMNYSTKNKNLLYLDFRISYIIIGTKINNNNQKLFDKAEIIFDNIDTFTNDFPYKYIYEEKKYISNPTHYDINCNNYCISINFGFDNNNSRNGLNLSRETSVIFNMYNKYSYEYLINEIYKFNYFLIIVLREHIMIDNLYFYKGNDKCKLFFCYKREKYVDRLEQSEIFRTIRPKIEEIKNINIIYNNYLKYFDKLYPVLDIYYSTICVPISDLNRFVVGITALEYFSNEFDKEGALYFYNQELNRKGKDINYVNKIRSLLEHSNCVFDFSQEQLVELSKKITDTRAYYIHYNKKRKSLSDYEKFYYSHFLFDILIINIGLIIRIDSNLLINITNYKRFYNKENIL